MIDIKLVRLENFQDNVRGSGNIVIGSQRWGFSNP